MSRTPTDEQQGCVNPGKVRKRPLLVLTAPSAQFSCRRPQLWWIWVRVSGGRGVSERLTSKGYLSSLSLHHGGVSILLCRNTFICIQHRNCLQCFLSVHNPSSLEPKLGPLCRRMNLTVEKKNFSLLTLLYGEMKFMLYVKGNTGLGIDVVQTAGIIWGSKQSLSRFSRLALNLWFPRLYVLGAGLGLHQSSH